MSNLSSWWILDISPGVRYTAESIFLILSLHYVNSFLCCAESWVQLNLVCLFLLLLSVFLKSSPSNVYPNQGEESFPQFSSSSFLLTAKGRDYQKQWTTDKRWNKGDPCNYCGYRKQTQRTHTTQFCLCTISREWKTLYIAWESSIVGLVSWKASRLESGGLLGLEFPSRVVKSSLANTLNVFCIPKGML